MPLGMPGKLIVEQGFDGSRKSTRANLLRRWLEIGGYCVYFTGWNSSPLVKKNVTKRAKKVQFFAPTTFSINHATDFVNRFDRQILLESGGRFDDMGERRRQEKTQFAFSEI